MGIHLTNWNKDGSQLAKREKQPNMMGEGLGNNLGLDGPKYVAGKPYRTPEQEELEERELRLEKFKNRQMGSVKAQITRHKNLATKNRIQQLLEDGKMIEGARVFFIEWPKDDWDIRAKNCGGMPEGVDISKTDFGNLVIVPVIEEEEGKKMKLDLQVDPEGRKFCISFSVREKVDMIFGRVNWKRPLTIREVSQFGRRVK